MTLSIEAKKARRTMVIVVFLLLFIGITLYEVIMLNVQRERLAMIGSAAEQDEKMAEGLVDTMFQFEITEENISQGAVMLERCGYSIQGERYLRQVRNSSFRLLAIPFAVSGCMVCVLFLVKMFSLQRVLKNYEKVVTDLRCQLEKAEREGKGYQTFLEKKEKQMQEFIENISHQIKNPLSCISVAMDTAMERYDFDELDAAFMYVDKIKELLKRLLTIGRLEAGKILFHYEDVDLEDYLYEAAEEVKSRGRNCIFTVNKEERETFVWHLDLEWIEEAIWNILNNCIEHTREHNLIKIELQINREAAVLSISDDGKGIEEEDLPYIFDRFYTAGKPDYSHTGIGLNLTKLIIEKHHASIRVWNRIESGGTEFVIIFPRYTLKNKLSV